MFGRSKKYKLPTVYRKFRRSCNWRTPWSLVGTDLRLNGENLNYWAKQLLEENAIECFLKDKDYVFMMHQGYIFWYFEANGDENPDVYSFHEGNEGLKTLMEILEASGCKHFFQDAMEMKFFQRGD